MQIDKSEIEAFIKVVVGHHVRSFSKTGEDIFSAFLYKGICSQLKAFYDFLDIENDSLDDFIQHIDDTLNAHIEFNKAVSSDKEMKE